MLEDILTKLWEVERDLRKKTDAVAIGLLLDLRRINYNLNPSSYAAINSILRKLREDFQERVYFNPNEARFERGILKEIEFAIQKLNSPLTYIV